MTRKDLAPDPRELLRKHNQMKEESRIRYYLDNKMTVTSIKPEWLRREICEAIGRGETITISIGNNYEFPIQLADPNHS